MTREEAVEKLKVFAPMVVDDTREALEMAIEALEQEPKTGEWIPCSERLPEDGQGVLVTVDANKWNIEVGSCIYSGGTFHSKLYDLDVLAWMPLPKPYREDGE